MAILLRRLRLTKISQDRPEKPATSRLLIVRNNPIPSEHPADSLAIMRVSDATVSDGVQRHLTSSDDEVGPDGDEGRQGKSNG